jgi:hypothetical protein
MIQRTATRCALKFPMTKTLPLPLALMVAVADLAELCCDALWRPSQLISISLDEEERRDLRD